MDKTTSLSGARERRHARIPCDPAVAVDVSRVGLIGLQLALREIAKTLRLSKRMRDIIRTAERTIVRLEVLLDDAERELMEKE